MTTRRIVICFIGTILSFLIITFTLHHPLNLLKSRINEENGSRTVFSGQSPGKHDMVTTTTKTESNNGGTPERKESVEGGASVKEKEESSVSSAAGTGEEVEQETASTTTEDSNFLKTTTDSEGKPLPFPIYEPTEDTAPGDSLSTPASEQLECRQNVIEFVINATDVKDECEGLRRAFDVSCQTIEISRKRSRLLLRIDDWAEARRRLSSSLSLPTKKRVNSQTIKDSILLQDQPVGSFINKKKIKRKHLSYKTKSSLKKFIATPEAEELKTCCASILSVFHEHCDRSDDGGYEDERLFVIVFVITLCGLVKSLIRYFRIRWLPEAAGCILVGVIFGLVLDYIPHIEMYFDEKMFLRLMLPPIVFDASLSINKHSFRRYATPIFIFACVGTVMASCLTAIIGTYYLSPNCPHIPIIESLAFGALISSIDPIAVLSVLSNMGVRSTDAVYILIFGESLLNDGIAVILFETLTHFMGGYTLDSTSIKEAALHLCFLSFGSIMIGIICGFFCLCYFWAMHGCHSPLVEILSFCCWALIPFYISDGVGWSGIVSIVAAGFFMDMYVVGEHNNALHNAVEGNNDIMQAPERSSSGTTYRCRRFISISGQISPLAKTHLGFVTSVISTLMETAIFSYLGLFLFKSRYHWNWRLTFISIFSCLASRAMMISTLAYLSNWISRRKSRMYRFMRSEYEVPPDNDFNPMIDKRMQVILWFAGLRGAMSFALVENLPLYDSSTGYGTRFKAELKAMTSASIIFTVFILGGSTFYAMEHLGMTMNKNDDGKGEDGTASLAMIPNKKNEEDELIHRGG